MTKYILLTLTLIWIAPSCWADDAPDAAFYRSAAEGGIAEVERTAERLINLLATFCILSWRIFWLTMINRSTRQAKAALAFTPLEVKLLNRLAPERISADSGRPSSLQSCLLQLARLGGYLNRAGDAPPGNTVIWRGMSRLTDIELGFLLGTENVGN
jgi:hypothetical protein